jgi:hypothetical protein
MNAPQVDKAPSDFGLSADQKAFCDKHKIPYELHAGSIKKIRGALNPPMKGTN